MKAIIMAGGEGSRLRPLTCDLPKPMVPIMNKPIMEHIIELLSKHGITEIGVTLMYLPQKIKESFGNGSNFGVNIHYFTEDTPLGTAGSVHNAVDFLDDTFIVISGDGLTNMNLTEAIEFHQKKKAVATLVLSKVAVPLEYGVVITDENSAITGFLEKPSWGEVFSDTVNTGTYILEPEMFKYFPKGKNYDFSQDLFPLLLREKRPLFGFITQDYWCDIGDLKAYLQSHIDIFEGKIDIKFDGTKLKENVWVGTGTIIEPGAEIIGPACIGNSCKISSKASIENYSVLGNNNVIEDEVSIKRSILWNNNFIEFGSEVRGAILCNKVNTKNYVSIFENAVIGDDCTLNERAIVKPNVKIWPQKAIDTLAIVDRNLIWGSKYIKTIFGENGLSGIINVDISPEFATRLGAAYGSLYKKGSKVVVSSTNSNAARMFKHAFVSGILSVGVEVFNLSSILTPVSRYAISFLSVEGGIHIKIAEGNPNRICADFMDSKGATISRAFERKIENSFVREDFKRCSAEEISRLNNITDFRNYYLRAIINEIDIPTIRQKQLKIVFYTPSDLVNSLIAQMLPDIGVKVVSSITDPFDTSNSEEIFEEIKKNNADFGAYIDSNGENLILFDRKKRTISEDLYTAMISIITFEMNTDANVIIPITTSTVIEKIAEKYSGKVTRTKTSSRAVMEEMLKQGPHKSRENLDQFMLNFDSFAGLLKIIEFISSKQTTLEEIIDQAPEFFISKKKIFCPWEQKGKVMRTLIQEKTKNKIELLDGVKFITSKGWVLVIPDVDKPLCRVYAEGTSKKSSEKLADEYIEKIKSIIEI